MIFLNKHICKYFKNKKTAMNDGDSLDIINSWINEISIVLCLFFSMLYYSDGLNSVRAIVSDTISVSSILLGILGVLIGILISLKEDSIFFKKAKEKGKDGFFYESLLIKLRNAFIINIFFVSYTLLFNLIKPSSFIIVKCTFIFIWAFLLIKIIWQSLYLMILITKIATYSSPKGNDPRKEIS